MTLTKRSHAEVLPGYRLIEPLGSGGFGEVWKCEAPGGLCKAIKFVYGNLLDPGLTDRHIREELQAIQHIKDIRHPFLLSIERVENRDGELLIVMELADQNLQEVFESDQAEGLPGIPRDELLKYLREAAEVLDLMNLECGLQHLDIKPSNLFLVRDHVKIGDFGLVKSLSDRQHGPQHGERGYGQPFSAITPVFAAPELFQGLMSPQSDQYSLAIVYQQLLTGHLPFEGKNLRQLMVQHTLQPPRLDSLPVADRSILARALAKKPEQRFATCTELVDALSEVKGEVSIKRNRRSGILRRGVNETNLTQVNGNTVQVAPTESRALPEYQFGAMVGRTELSENWEARHATGRRCQVKFLRSVARGALWNQQVFNKLRSLNHPALLPMEVRHGGPGCLVVVTDPVEPTLRARFQECQAAGHPGIPRQELLRHLRPVAEALDELSRRQRLQHLELNPRVILLPRGREHVKIADFGLVQLLWLPVAQNRSKLQTRYVAPELLKGKLNRYCDQYSLAIVYQEMLTGTHPFGGRAGGGPLRPRVESLPEQDRDIVARALDVDPHLRFASATEFITILEQAGNQAPVAADHASALVCDKAVAPENHPTVAGIKRLLAEATLATTPTPSIHPALPLPTRDGLVLQARFQVAVPLQGALLRFERFRVRWNAQVIHADERGVAFRVGAPANQGEGTGLVVEIHWTAAHPEGAEIQVRIRPGASASPEAVRLLDELGPELLESLRRDLQGEHERRRMDRVFWPHPVQVAFLHDTHPLGKTIPCLGKDLSLTGLGLYLPASLPSNHVRLVLSAGGEAAPVVVHGIIVRVQRCVQRLFEVGVRFLFDDPPRQ